MKKLFLYLLINAALFGHVFAQTKTDPELQKLVKTVATLRNSNSKAWDNAFKTFEDDLLWTPMDEVMKDENECYLIGDNQFKLNGILSKCSDRDKKMVRGDYLNGNDPNYNYSLTERGIKKQSSVNYEMSYRQGHQTFVVMPYTTTPNKIEVQTYVNGKAKGEITIDDGNIVVRIDENIKLSDVIRLVITNHGDENMSVVIINHNTRKP